MGDKETKAEIIAALGRFEGGNLARNATRLFDALGYRSEKTVELEPRSYAGLQPLFDLQRQLNLADALVDEWRSVDVVFQLTDEEVRNAGPQGHFVFESRNIVDNALIQSYLIFAIELRGATYTRTQLATATRALNKLFRMPVLILFKHGATLTLSIIDRRLSKVDTDKDVLEKVTLIKDIAFVLPHRAHVEILFDLSLPQLHAHHNPTNFVELHRAWHKTLDTSELNKRFFKEVANWYFWAVKTVRFPKDAGPDEEARNTTSVIRMITRLIFVWFVKEKGLIPDELFDRRKLHDVLTWSDPNGTYYKAILQNLFFATLNQEMNPAGRPRARDWRKDGQNYNVTNLYRYRRYFRNPDAALALFANIPFLNGGLFECLDKPERNGGSKPLRIDGFSDRPDNELVVPDELFFGDTRYLDLNEVFGTSNKQYPTRGLFHIFEGYKFTVDENTPVEEEIALDPELLGRVFENLLAQYNPETGVTARKQTGSFYTPREIVSYMVDESLLAYLGEKLPAGTEDNEVRLRGLIGYNTTQHSFDEQEVKALINAIDQVKILDPACGSGAFPMGVLHKLVYLLSRLDPGNVAWKRKQIQKAETIDEPGAREKAVADIEQAFELNELDYGRKLYLIENCIYGVDIQPIAVQIAKLRFFISLVVDQRVDNTQPNRGIRPLPNLETKFVAANTLIAIDRPQQLAMRNPEIDEKEAELARVRDRYFTARTPGTKNKHREQDKALRAEIAALLKQDGFESITTEKLAYWDPYDQNSSASFFDPEWMFGLRRGFDVVIGNPPYIKEYTHRQAFDGVRGSPYYQGKMDIWYMFACQALDELKAGGGVLTFIATNNWVTNSGASRMRKKIADDGRIMKLLDFGEYKIFESADIQTMVLLCVRDSCSDHYTFDYRRIEVPTPSLSDLLDLLDGIANTNLTYLQPSFDREYYRDRTFVFSHADLGSILDKMVRKASHYLNPKTEIAQGIVAPQEDVNRASKAKLGAKVKVGEGIFVLGDDERNALGLSARELGLLRPFYTTQQLHRYYAAQTTQKWIVYTDSSFKNPHKMKPYPRLRRHLDRFAAIITSDNRPYGLHRSRNESFFVGEKIVSLRKCERPTFSYSDFDCYVSQTFNVIKPRSINTKFLTGVLNSRLIAFWLRTKGKMQGHIYQIDNAPLSQIPLIQGTKEAEEAIEELVDRIRLTLAEDLAADIGEAETAIDRYVYEMYDLSTEEIALVEREMG